ncbi:hypothetical protein ACHAXS_000524 [Conticribra weissflogii]
MSVFFQLGTVMNVMSGHKSLLVLAARSSFIAIAIQLFLPYLLPNGPPVHIPLSKRPRPTLDRRNVSLRLSSGKVTKIYERLTEGQEPLLIGPETVVLDNRGVIYSMTEDSKLVTLTKLQPDESNPHTMTAVVTQVANLGPGRALGGKFDKNGCLYFADVLMGLARICIKKSNQQNVKVELIASSVQLEDGSWSDIAYADDVDIGPKTGHVYFSDASDVRVDRDVKSGKWDIMYASKVEAMRGKMTGRILRFKPESGQVDVLATGAAFANGVAVDKDETFILYTSTYEGAVMKYFLDGDKKGQSEKILTQFPGFLDGADCSFERGTCYVAIPSTISPLAGLVFSMPDFIGKPIRSLLMILPRWMTPNAEPYGGVAEIYPGSATIPPSVKRIFQDPDGRDVNIITGVTEFKGKLYLGSLHENYITVYDLD